MDTFIQLHSVSCSDSEKEAFNASVNKISSIWNVYGLQHRGWLLNMLLNMSTYDHYRSTSFWRTCDMFLIPWGKTYGETQAKGVIIMN